jgi:hypothetical protein
MPVRVESERLDPPKMATPVEPEYFGPFAYLSDPYDNPQATERYASRRGGITGTVVA